MSSCVPLFQLCSCPSVFLLSSCAFIQLCTCLVVRSQKAGQWPWHRAHGLAPVGAQMSSNDGLIGLMCEMCLVPKWGPHVWVLAQLYQEGSCFRKAVAPNTVVPDGISQTGCSCHHVPGIEHRALGLSPPSCPFIASLAHPPSTCACWCLLCEISAR